MAPRVRNLSNALAFATLTSARAAAADEPSCSAIRVSAAETLPPEWREAVETVRRELASRVAECVPIELTVRSAGGGALVVATGRDGRIATRSVRRPADLEAVALGLVASIPPDAPSTRPPEPAIVEVTSTPTDLPPPEAAPPKPQPRDRPSPAAVGLELGGRFGMPTGVLSPELELHADIRFDTWFATTGMQAAFAGTRPGRASIGGYDYEEYAFGLGVGRRFVVGKTYLELAAGPRMVVITEEGDVPDDGVGGTRTDLWLEGSVKWLLPGERWRPLAALEIDGAPRHFTAAARVDERLPGLPSWSSAVHIGVIGDVP